MWYCYVLFVILQETSEILELTPFYTARIDSVRPVQDQPNYTEGSTTRGNNSPRQGQVYGPYRILYGPYKLFRKPRLELETETAGEAEKESFYFAISGIKGDIPDLRTTFHSFLVFGSQGRAWRRRRRSFTTDLWIFDCFSMNSLITFIVLSFENMSS